MSDNKSGQGNKPSGSPGLMAIGLAAVAGWLIYSMATATEMPSRPLLILQYVLLAGALIGLAGAVVKLISAK